MGGGGGGNYASGPKVDEFPDCDGINIHHSIITITICVFFKLNSFCSFALRSSGVPGGLRPADLGRAEFASEDTGGAIKSPRGRMTFPQSFS